jgi:formylglycine-generating enzyme required for sulfatase activity
MEWLLQFTDRAHVNKLVYNFVADIYREAGAYMDEARCLALAGKEEQAAEIYLKHHQKSKAITCLINGKAYNRALDESLKWLNALDKNDISGHVTARLYISCCLIHLNKDKSEAHKNYIEAREIIESEEYRKGCLAGNIWESLGIYGNTILRDDLIRIGYEKALSYYEECNPSEWKRTIQSYITAISFDRLLVHELKHQLESKFPENEDSLPQSITNSLGMTFVLIPAGTFMMGSPEDEPGRSSGEILHEVTLTQPYYMQTTQVTQGQWKSVKGNNPSRFKDGGPSCPVEQVSWEDTQAFIYKLNQQEGTGKYRLPTEAEWEYACRAGTDGPFYFGRCLSTDQANYNGNHPLGDCPKGEFREKTTPVGNFECNNYGLYDMHGNVLEWCQDFYGGYPASPVTDPTGPENGASRVLRGGTWINHAVDCRSASRYRNWPGRRYRYTGFRLVFSPGQH